AESTCACAGVDKVSPSHRATRRRAQPPTTDARNRRNDGGEAAYNRAVRFVLALVLLAVPAGSAAVGAHAKKPATAASVSRVRGVVAWTGRVPDFADPGCDLQADDFGGRTDL